MFWKKKSTYPTVHITDETFQELVAESKVPVLLDFYADWCGPCKMLSPIINELAESFEGRALVAKVDTEANPKLSQHFKIKSIPTMMIFNKGNFHEKFNGIVPKPNLEEILEDYIASTNVNGRPASFGEEEE